MDFHFEGGTRTGALKTLESIQFILRRSLLVSLGELSPLLCLLALSLATFPMSMALHVTFTCFEVDMLSTPYVLSINANKIETGLSANNKTSALCLG